MYDPYASLIRSVFAGRRWLTKRTLDVRSLSFFYSLVSTGCVDPNEMISNNKASTLLVLLMIAQGASAVPTAEARALSAGLVETCRISLFDIIEKVDWTTTYDVLGRR